MHTGFTEKHLCVFHFFDLCLVLSFVFLSTLVSADLGAICGKFSMLVKDIHRHKRALIHEYLSRQVKDIACDKMY